MNYNFVFTDKTTEVMSSNESGPFRLYYLEKCLSSTTCGELEESIDGLCIWGNTHHIDEFADLHSEAEYGDVDLDVLKGKVVDLLLREGLEDYVNVVLNPISEDEIWE